MERVIRVVAAAILDPNLRILCAQRSAEDRYPYKWEFPGGKIEAGETPEEALKRELKEELSVEAKIRNRIVSTSFSYDTFQLDLILFDVTVLNGIIMPNVHHSLKWVPLNETGELDWLPADFPLIEAIREYYSGSLEQ